MRTLKTSFFILGLAGYLSSAAGPEQNFCLRAFRKALGTGELTGIEMEVPMTAKILKLMESQDGTTGPVLNGEFPPEWLLDRAKSEGFSYWTYPWSRLTVTERLDVLRAGAKQVDFFESRTVPGVRMPKQVTVKLESPTPFQASELTAGSHDLTVGRNWGAVEYVAPGEVKRVNGLELHYRSTDSAGKAARDAWTLIERSGMAEKKPYLHAHIVRKMSELLPKRSGELEVAKLADFKRRLEVFLQMRNRLLGYTVSERKAIAQGIPIQLSGPMTESQMVKLTEWLLSVAKGEPTKAHPELDFKIAQVGLRGPKTYWSQEDLLGMEVRAIPSPQKLGAKYEQETEEMLNAFQSAYFHPEFGLARGKIQKWLSRDNKMPLAQRMGESYYDKKDIFSHREQMPPSLVKFLDSDVEHWVRVLAPAEKDHAYKMLLHDWSRDPLFFDRPKAAAKILAAQERALKSLATGNPSQDPAVLQKFLLESDLFKNYANSIGIYMDPRPVERVP